MRLLLMVAVLLVLYVCNTKRTVLDVNQCSRKYCKTVACNPNLTRETCLAKGATGRFIFKNKGSKCGCCDFCFIVLNENDYCTVQLLIGAHHYTRCVAGTQCTIESNELKCKKTYA